MKFGRLLARSMVQEWKDLYVDYFGLKLQLVDVVASIEAESRHGLDDAEGGATPLLVALAPLGREDDDEAGDEASAGAGSGAGSLSIELRSLGNKRVVGQRCLSERGGAGMTQAQYRFYESLDGDVARVESFYLRTLKSIDARLLRVQGAIGALDEGSSVRSPMRGGARRRGAPGAGAASRREIREELLQLHLLCSLLKSFCEMNAMAVAKIVKKHDKLVGRSWKSLYTGAAEGCSFWREGPKTADELRESVVGVFAEIFTGGDASAARGGLRDGTGDCYRPDPSADRALDTFVAGLMIGGAACAAAALLLARRKLESPIESLDGVSWAAVRLVSLPALHVLGFAFDVLAWDVLRVNWVNVFAMLPARSAVGLEWARVAGPAKRRATSLQHEWSSPFKTAARGMVPRRRGSYDATST